MTKVSIIVSVYNPAEEFLEECITSLVNQTLEEIEIILVDNGSTNNNPKILKTYDEKYSKIKLIKFEQNVGFAKAVNRAFKIAIGEYIQIVDSDDWIENDTCENLYQKAKKYNSDLIIFGATPYNQKIGVFEDNPLYSLDAIPNKYTYKTFTFAEGYKWLFYTPLQDWNKFVHKDLIYKFDNFMFEELPYVFSDCVYSAKNYVNAKNIICDKRIYYKYRTNISSSVVGGYSRENCSYLNAPFIFAKEFDQIARSVNDNTKVFGFIYSNIAHILGYYDMAHKNNKKLVYDMMRKYFFELDKSIYTNNNMTHLDRHTQKFIYKCKKYPYWLFVLINFLFRKEVKNHVQRVRVFGIRIYKKISKS